MTLVQLHQQIGQVQRQIDRHAQGLHRLDFLADCCGHPMQGVAREEAVQQRCILRSLFIRLHTLEARLPTPELLGERAYNRLLMLGFDTQAAEAGRRSAYQAAAKPAVSESCPRVLRRLRELHGSDCC